MAAQSVASAHPSEQTAQEERRYLQVFLWLAVLTAVEIGVIYLPLPHVEIAVMLIVLAATKASLVGLFYMHLAYEKRTLTYIALTPLVLCVFLLFMLTPDLGAFTRLLTHQTPQAGSGEAHPSE
ncbi:MAG TPA: cytochrome C oxidase subunit IV family protein [Candidatus Binatia bacterium]|nr:cytochrome C oxidase subunit IV family protein [Candidatus Binatia bacterium]